MTDDIRKLKEIIQSSNINFLIGAGISRPFLPVLGDIEKRIEEAEGDDTKILEQLKHYFNEVMYPCTNIADLGRSLDTANKARFDESYMGYSKLFNAVNRILLNRKGSLLNKQVNIFTTNIDIFMERVLEDMNLEYNDGFNGNIVPVFQTSNFHKSIHKTSSHFGNISEIPIFNIIKLHGSLSWEVDSSGNNLTYSRLGALAALKSVEDSDTDFKSQYDALQIVNPSKDKFKQTVMGVTHYELLRMYSSELEKENSVLFILGFSMADEHIREITLRVANSNPTLKIYLFCYSNCVVSEECDSKPTEDKCNYHKCSEWFSKLKYKNVEILKPTEDNKYNVQTVVADYLEAIFLDDKPSVDSGADTEIPELSE